jgi:hypothetical protein
MLYVLFAVLGFWLFSNLIVIIKYKSCEMWQDLVIDQNIVGRIFANIYYLPYWVIMFIWCAFKRYVVKNVVRFVKYCYFAVARFLQEIYHSIFDIL